MIAEGRVAVNGAGHRQPGAERRPPRDKIAVDGKPLAAPEAARLWLYHKPAGLVTTAKDEKGRETVFDKLPDGPAAGDVGRPARPDLGGLLAADQRWRAEAAAGTAVDRLAAQVPGPGQGQRPTRPALEPLRQGLVVDGERFQPMMVDARPPAGRQRLADGGAARGPQPRDPAGDGGGRAGGEPADPGLLRSVPAGRAGPPARSRRCDRRCCATSWGSAPPTPPRQPSRRRNRRPRPRRPAGRARPGRGRAKPGPGRGPGRRRDRARRGSGPGAGRRNRDAAAPREGFGPVDFRRFIVFPKGYTGSP